MAALQSFANGIWPLLLEGRQRISRASLEAPWSRGAMAIRLRNQAEMLGDYVRRGDSVLDAGYGMGYPSKYLEAIYGAEPTGLDVKDFRVDPIAFHSFDGTSIPFPDSTFDIFQRFYRLRSTRSVDHRSALVRVSDKAVNVVRIAMPQECFDVFYNAPRYLCVYALSVG